MDLAILLEAFVEFQALSEAIRYSDPMSNEALFELENDIIAECGKAVKTVSSSV